MAYVELYASKSGSGTVSMSELATKLGNSSYGYEIESSGGVSGINVNKNSVRVEAGETEEVTVSLESGSYYAKIKGAWYNFRIVNDKVVLGEALDEVPEDTSSGTLALDTENNPIDTNVATASLDTTTNKITITGVAEGSTSVTVKYGTYSKTISISVPAPGVTTYSIVVSSEDTNKGTVNTAGGSYEEETAPIR